MSWIVIVWSTLSAVCVALAAIHGHIWWRLRARSADGAFAVMSLSVAVVALLELAMMHARTPQAFCALVPWYYLPLLTGTVSLVIFVRAYLGVGRRWLGGLAIAMRTVATGLGLLLEPNLHFSEVASLEHVVLLGAPIRAPVGTPNPWMPVATLASLVLVTFYVDAAIQLWRRGERRRALALSASLAFFVAGALTSGLLTVWGDGRLPFAITPFFAPVVVLMGLQLGRDLLRTVRLASELSEAQQRLIASERRLSVAADAAQAGFWTLDPATGRFWGTARAMAMFGFSHDDSPTPEELLETIHPDDRDAVRAALSTLLDSDPADGYGARPRSTDAADAARGVPTSSASEHVSIEYRVQVPGGDTRWCESFGGIVHGAPGGARVLMGMTLDVTERRRAEAALVAQRQELEHLSRVVTIGELSDVLARELAEPLEQVMSDARSARALLARVPVDPARLRPPMQAIVEAVEHAGQVVGRLRKLLRRGASEREHVSVDALVESVLGFLRSDLAARGVVVETRLRAVPPVEAERVPIEQVLIDLIRYACEAMSAADPSERRLTVSTRAEDGGVSVEVADLGMGLPPNPANLFEPFREGLPDGAGIGLSICRSIVEAHGGRIRAEPGEARGARVTFWLPASSECPVA